MTWGGGYRNLFGVEKTRGLTEQGGKELRGERALSA